MNNDSKLPISLKLKQINPLPDRIKKYFDICLEKLGLIPNVLLAYSHNTNKSDTFTNMYNEIMLSDSGLSKLQREMIAVVVSSYNKCFYCVVAHGAAVRQLSKNPILGDQLSINYKSAKLNKRQKLMLDFSVKLTESPHKIENLDRETLRKNRFTEEEILEIVEITSFFNMSNRIASGTDMKPNEQYHTMNRE